MESLALNQRRTPKKDLVAGIGASVLVHLLAFSSAFVWALVMPHKSFTPPYCAVNLVSLKELGIGSSEPKGSPKGADETDVSSVSKSAGNSSKTHQKSEGTVPIKRLTVDEAAVKPESQIKKIEPKEVPVVPEKPQSLEAIEKNLDKLIARPKAVPHTATASAQQDQQPKASGQPSSSAAGSQPGSEKVARGTPTGVGEGGAKGAAQGSAFGSPDGSGAASAIAQIYGERIKSAIRQEFKLPDQNFANVTARILFVVNREGKVLSFQLEKSAGNSLFDGASVRAIQNASIPPMPQAMEGSKAEIRVTFSPQGVS